jgi:uncharacterized protein YaiE (UPF0345 family)
MSSMNQFNNVSVDSKANVYFDGKCISHSITLDDGSKKSIGVIMPSTLTFKTGVPETMECVAGSCRVKLAGEIDWTTYGAGQSFSVPGSSSFDIEVTGEPYHYICHFA